MKRDTSGTKCNVQSKITTERKILYTPVRVNQSTMSGSTATVLTISSPVHF